MPTALEKQESGIDPQHSAPAEPADKTGAEGAEKDGTGDGDRYERYLATPRPVPIGAGHD